MILFREMLLRAQKGDKDAMQQLLTLYSRMIESACKVNGITDWDLRQFILLCIIQELPKFRSRIIAYITNYTISGPCY